MATILVVDDNDMFGETLAELLAHAGHRSIRVGSGTAAIEQLQRETPDVVLLDYFMSGMSGLETLRSIRGDSNTAAVPVVMISALGEQDEIEDALASGANEFWIKTTFDFNELNRRLSRYEHGPSSNGSTTHA